MRVGRYRIEERIGAGAMGEVWLGVDEGLGRRAALKFLGEAQLRNATTRERFVREAQKVARLSHQNLIVVYEAGEWEGRPYFAMELLEGGDAHQLMVEQGPLGSGVVANIGTQAAAGLAEAERAGIVHRDVKPSNLGFTGRDIVKVTDFGLAKAQTLEASLTGKGRVVGTADYIAPEQARGEPLDGRADVYGLGCTLFHLATGRPPYRRDSRQEMMRYMEVIRDHLQAPVPDVRAMVPGVDDELADIIRSAMQKRRDERPTLEELSRRLGRVAERWKGDLPRVTHPRIMAEQGTPTVDERPRDVVVSMVAEPPSLPPPAAAPAAPGAPAVSRVPGSMTTPDATGVGGAFDAQVTVHSPAPRVAGASPPAAAGAASARPVVDEAASSAADSAADHASSVRRPAPRWWLLLVAGFAGAAVALGVAWLVMVHGR